MDYPTVKSIRVKQFDVKTVLKLQQVSVKINNKEKLYKKLLRLLNRPIDITGLRVNSWKGKGTIVSMSKWECTPNMVHVSWDNEPNNYPQKYPLSFLDIRENHVSIQTLEGEIFLIR